MAYTKQTFTAGQTLKASDLNTMSQGIKDLDDGKQNKLTIDSALSSSSTNPIQNKVVYSELAKKQNTLVSGASLKTVNGISLLGSGNVAIEAVEKKVVVPPMRSHLIPLPVTEDYYNGKKIACIGDSITAGVGASDTSKRYTNVVASMLGASLVNLGASGTVLCTGGHRTCNIGNLSADKLTGCDVVTIMMGINDWDQAKADYYDLGEYGSTDTTTIYGAVDMWCKKIEEIRNTSGFENTKFYFITPIVTSWNHSKGGNNWDQNKVNIHGFTLRDLCQAIINVCADYDVPVLDMNKYSGIYWNSSSDQNAEGMFTDGIHPNDAGHAQIASSLRDYLIENLSYASQDELNKYAVNYLLQSVLADARKVTYPTFEKASSDVVELTGITLTPSTLSLTAGQSATVTPTFVPSNTTQTSITWTSSNTSVATVSDGLVTALAQGSATITCKSADNSAISATVSVSVANAQSTDITGLLISESTKTVEQGQTATLSVSYVPSTTTQKGVTWSSDNTAVATVVGNGDSCTVTAVGGGQCNIIATSTVNSSIKASCFFTTSASEGEEDEPDSDTWTLGANVRRSSDGTLSGSDTGSSPLSNSANAAIYNMALLPGMEVEVEHNKNGTGSYSNFVLWGVDVAKNTDEITKSDNFTIGKFNVYYDATKAPVKSILGSTSNQFYLLETGNTNYPRVAVIKRDANGVISVTYNGVEATMPVDYAGYQTACNTEKLYVFIGGIDSKSTWKMNYFGSLR